MWLDDPKAWRTGRRLCVLSGSGPSGLSSSGSRRRHHHLLLLLLLLRSRETRSITSVLRQMFPTPFACARSIGFFFFFFFFFFLGGGGGGGRIAAESFLDIYMYAYKVVKNNTLGNVANTTEDFTKRLARLGFFRSQVPPSEMTKRKMRATLPSPN